ncbi:class I SAM-dependent methyltransferase [Effusibacillus consociatus]|uniref:Class I SAM-dependent methyltransferase n=1 Tax=Effusibacillus consociatus TaxID=1117041 RepID=A0ABV9PYV0_9BACL
MELSPKWYHWFVRPKWVTHRYIHNVIQDYFDFNGKTVIDFGCGVGSNSSMFAPASYLGLDCDSQRISYAQRLYPDYSFQVFDRNRVPVADNSVDYILIVAVLHHIPSEELHAYLQEFRRILKPYGKIIVMEPCLDLNSPVSNWFMTFFDKGHYIRNEDDYMKLFLRNEYQINRLKQFKKLLLYNELFFSAVPK